jgi:2-(1,2-epoxy-1,2-dihydrophenyl)acetyl-CoA isomerase
MTQRRQIETGTDDLIAHVEDRVAIITMNRPERRNALSSAMLSALEVVLAEVELATAFTKVGFSGDYGGSYFITKLVGAAKARELYLLSDRIDAKEAERLGLVNRVVPEDALEKETAALAHRLAHGPAVAYRYVKENLNRALEGGGLGECLDLEATHHVHASFTQDHRNAAKAFVAKQKPVFEGR